jgi:hypothetical protein
MSISSKELAKSKIKKLTDKYVQSRGGDFTEQDTITNFILPFLESLGWNIHDVYEVKQQGYPVNWRRTLPAESRPLDKPDCVILVNGNPYVVLEFKPLTDGGHIDRYENRVKKLQEKAEYLSAKYAVLANFSETIVYDGVNGKELIRFSYPKEYLDKFDELWKYLSKERTSL